MYNLALTVGLYENPITAVLNVARSVVNATVGFVEGQISWALNLIPNALAQVDLAATKATAAAKTTSAAKAASVAAGDDGAADASAGKTGTRNRSKAKSARHSAKSSGKHAHHSDGN